MVSLRDQQVRPWALAAPAVLLARCSALQEPLFALMEQLLLLPPPLLLLLACS